jgi:hypothetical protein
MDGNTGRSEGATAEKAVPFPCAVIDPNRSFVELRVGEPRPGAQQASIVRAFFMATSNTCVRLSVMSRLAHR